jgi:dTDP-4-dehydrorhamnose reductase
VKLDICNPSQVKHAFAKAQPDVVVHTAALTHVDMCERNRELAWNVNVEGTKNIAMHAQRSGALLIYVSTDYVFSGETGMYRETDDPDPINYYGVTKLEGETRVQRLVDEWCIIRPSVIYGALPAAGKINFALWLIKSLQNNKSLNIVTDQTISPTLNTNLSHMLLEIAKRRLSGIYHLAGATPITRYDFAQALAHEFHLNPALIQPALSKDMPWHAQRPRNTSLNIEKAQCNLHHHPMPITQAMTQLRLEMKNILGQHSR